MSLAPISRPSRAGRFVVGTIVTVEGTSCVVVTSYRGSAITDEDRDGYAPWCATVRPATEADVAAASAAPAKSDEETERRRVLDLPFVIFGAVQSRDGGYAPLSSIPAGGREVTLRGTVYRLVDGTIYEMEADCDGDCRTTTDAGALAAFDELAG